MLTVFHIPVNTGLDAIDILNSITPNLGPHVPVTIASFTHMATTWKECIVKLGVIHFFSFPKDFCEIECLRSYV